MQRKTTEQVTFRQAVAALTGAIITNHSPVKGRITTLTFHFPPGCAALVSVQFRATRGRFPTGATMLALDNATPVYPVDIPVWRDEVLTVEVQNGDAVNPHTPSVIATIEAE